MLIANFLIHLVIDLGLTREQRESLTETSEKRAKEFFAAFETLSRAVNTSQHDQDLFNRAFVCGTGHRTLEQNLMRYVYGLLEFLAENTNKTDLRNEASRKNAKQMIEHFKSENGGYKPSEFLPKI